jgi:two-component system NtrC family sensor kinase
MNRRFLTVTLILAALFSGVVLWCVDRFVYGNRMEWAEAQARNQMSSLTQAINTEITGGRRLLNTISNETFRPDTANWKAYQPYYALALMTSQNGVMSISRMVTKQGSPAAGWNPVLLTQYLGFLGKDLESKSAVILRAFKDAQKNRHVALVIAGGGNAYIWVGNGENFQALIDSQKGSMSSFAIMASDGLTISHPIPEYIGNVMSDNPLLKEIRRTGAAQGVGTFLQGRKKVFGMYEKINGTNAYVISSVPLEDLMRGRLSLAWQFVFLAAGVSLLGAALYFWTENNQSEKQVAVSASPAAAAPVVNPTLTVKSAAPKPVSVAPAAPPPVQPLATPSTLSKPSLPQTAGSHQPAVVVSNSALIAPSAPRSFEAPAAPASAFDEATGDIQQDKADAYRQVASALGQEMRAPLASILGFSQMVLSKTNDPEVVQAVESILREARSSRDVLEKLSTFSGQRASDKAEFKIEQPISTALKNIDKILLEKGVHVEKDFRETTPWPLANDEMVKVFENLFSNAVEAMERMQNKLLKISVWETSGNLHVVVSDSGEGIAPENLKKIFDPFYTTRSFAHHVGLGLPVVYGILKEHHADVQIKSVRGEGTQVEIVFSAEAKSAVRTAAVKAPTPVPEPSPAKSARAVKNADAPTGPVIVAASPSPSSRLTDVNVDRLLDISNDDAPLEFLDGLGFGGDTEKATRPAPVPMPMKPSSAPPTVQSSTTAPAPLPPRFNIDEDAEFQTDPLYEPEAPFANRPQDQKLVDDEITQEITLPPAINAASDLGIDAAVEMHIDIEATKQLQSEAENSVEVISLEQPRAVSEIPEELLTQSEDVAVENNGGSDLVETEMNVSQDTDENEVEEFVAGPKPSLPSRAPAIMPPEFRAEDSEEPTVIASLAPLPDAVAALPANEPEPLPQPSVVIDAPKARASTKASDLDSYKVNIRRPGKRT